MTTLTLKLSKALDEQLTVTAKRRRASKAAIAHQALNIWRDRMNRRASTWQNT